MLDLAELVSGLVEELVVLGSALSGAGFDAVGSVREGVPGECGDEVVDERLPAPAAGGGDGSG